MINDDILLEEQVRYYQARAPEYDLWFKRRGPYDLGTEHTTRWNAEVEAVRKALHSSPLRGDVLELACGTGWWTGELARHDVAITAVDSSREAIALNGKRVGRSTVTYLHANIFDWRPDRSFETIFFGFWLSHVPPDRFEAFWELIDSCLSPTGRVFFVDNRWYPEYRWPQGQTQPSDAPRYVARRQLCDGRHFRIVKVFYEANELERRLSNLGWAGQISETSNFFIWGDLRRRTGVSVSLIHRSDGRSSSRP